MKDIQLAVAVCRVYEGDDGPVLRKLIQDEILPLAAHEGNRWLASWAFWMLGRKDMAVRALIVSLVKPKFWFTAFIRHHELTHLSRCRCSLSWKHHVRLTSSRVYS